jgi:hypothetical protein
MRAKTINEVQNFDRNMPTKAAIGVGGIVLGKELWDRKLEYIKEWKNFIEKLFLHKTIYGTFAKYTWNKGDSVPKFEGWAKYKVEVERVLVQDGTEREGLPTEIKIVGKDKAWYNIPVDDKEIYILNNES